MHNLHFAVTKADSPEEACSYVESRIEGYGNVNNWFSICGCVSKNNQVYNTDEGRWKAGEYSTIKALNNVATGWLNLDSFLAEPEKIKETMYEASQGQHLACPDWNNIQMYADHMMHVANRTKLNVLKDEFKAWQFDEKGITQMDGCGEKKYVVFIDMHS